MTKKFEQVQKLYKRIQPRHPLPKPVESFSLLEHGLLVMFVRHMPQEKAETAIGHLRKAYPDWNEMRVAQTQEIALFISGRGKRASRESLANVWSAARDAREFLQEVFQKTHAMDLEFLRDDLTAGAKMLQGMPVFGLSGVAFVLWLGGNRELPVQPALVRVLDRLGLITRAAGKKARDVVAPLVPEGDELGFVSAFGEIADRWCFAQKPICQECPLVGECPYGKKAFAEWKVQQARAEAQRIKDAARRAIIEKKESEKRQREEARAAKKAAIENAKLARIRTKQEAALQKQKQIEAAKQQKLAAAAKKAAEIARAKAKKGVIQAKGSAKKPVAGAKSKSAPSSAKKSGGSKPKKK